MHVFLGDWLAVCCDRTTAEYTLWEMRQESHFGLACREPPKINGAVKGLQLKECCDQTYVTLSSFSITASGVTFMKYLSCQTPTIMHQSSFLPICLFFLHSPTSILHVVPISWPLTSQSNVQHRNYWILPTTYI